MKYRISYRMKGEASMAMPSVRSFDAAVLEAFFSDFSADFLRSPQGAPYRGTRFSIFPGFCDVHVHFREPGFSYKETIFSGSAAAARGGYTAVCTMPNLNPVPDTLSSLTPQLQKIASDAKIHIYPYGSITRGQQGEALSHMADMAPYVVGFSDDGKGVQDRERMREAMLLAKQLGKVIAAHCEDNSLLHGGYIHQGTYAAAHGHPGICSESEWGPIERDLELVRDTGCAYHVCHVSTRESVELIRQAKKDGLDVTCETGPHYLILDDSNLQEDGRFKMNPPLRDRTDREALVEGVLDGTIDMIATDHAPHSREEKSRGLAKSAFGVVGLETAFQELYTHLVRTGILPLETLIFRMAYAPRTRFSIPLCQSLTIWALEDETTVDPADFLSMGTATPFAGDRVRGVCAATVCDGKIVYQNKELIL